ncbi:unnamed protein product, partial [Pylaiella littoralis]
AGALPVAGGVPVAMHGERRTEDRIRFSYPTVGLSADPARVFGRWRGAAGPGLPPQAPGLGGAAGGPSDPAEVGSADGGGSAAAPGSRKRTLAELHAAVDELSERQSLADGLGQPAERDAVATPPARRPMTY